jgi:CBS domain-containing protein
MAYGLPVDGEDGPFAGGAVTEVPTCDVDGTVADARAALEGTEGDVLIVVSCDGLAVGAVEREALSAADADAALLDVMDVVPGTVRPSVEMASLSGRSLVTTSDGRLLGEVVPDGVEQDVHDTLHAVHEHFGDRQPSEDELRSFLEERSEKE